MPYDTKFRRIHRMPYDYIVCHTILTLAGVQGMALRAAYAKAFPQDKHLQAWAKKTKPAARTKESSVRSGERVVSGASTKPYEAYYRVDIFTELLWYHNKNKHVLYDNAHQFANVLKQMMNTIKNRTKKDKLQFNANIRKVERKNGNCIHTHCMPYA
jgi:ornithine carbamoyltransferase